MLQILQQLRQMEKPTYLSFKPCSERLKSSLMDTKLSNPLHMESREEIEIFNAIVTDANEVM